MPLRFVGPQGLRWSGGPKHGGKEIFFNGTSTQCLSPVTFPIMQEPFDGAGTYVTEGTTPAGSQWSRCPIPRNDMHQTGRGFAPPCMQFGMPAAMCQGMEDGQGGAEPTLEIVDRVLIPEGTPPGECECSNGRGAGDLGFDPDRCAQMFLAGAGEPPPIAFCACCWCRCCCIPPRTAVKLRRNVSLGARDCEESNRAPQTPNLCWHGC